MRRGLLHHHPGPAKDPTAQSGISVARHRPDQRRRQAGHAHLPEEDARPGHAAAGSGGVRDEAGGDGGALHGKRRRRQMEKVLRRERHRGRVSR